MNTQLNTTTPDPGLDAEVRRLLQLHRGYGHWQVIADASGISYSWLSKFTRGKIANPGYGTLKRLHEYLRDKPPPIRLSASPTVLPPALAVVGSID